MHHVALCLLALPCLVASAYLFLLTVFAWRRSPANEPDRSLRFDVVVPAHDEETSIGRTVRSLRAIDWPRDGFRIVVVADNCSDGTAGRAAEAGASVLVRQDAARRGKGRALEHAFQQGMADRFADAFVVVDADSVVSANLLSAFASRLASGAQAVQARYGVLNPEASWRTGLMSLAFALVNDVRSLGRERLGVSCSLRGNGMCFSRRALAMVPYDAFSIVEDVEYGIRLGEAGIRVRYAPEAAVLGEMVPGERASRSQRLRWEGGRLSLMLRRGPRLLLESLRRRSFLLLDLALDLLVPPLAWLTLYVLLVTCISGIHSAHHGAVLASLGMSLASMGFILAYVVRGCHASGLGVAVVGLLPFLPVYVVWKVFLLLSASGRTPKEFIRTAREGSPDEPQPPSA